MKFVKLVALIGLLALAGCNSLKIPVTELHNKQIVQLPAEVHRTNAEKAPTVILLHGCGGPERNHLQGWIKALNGWGYNAVVINSIEPRGASQICNQTFRVVTYEQRSADAYDTAKWILQQGWSTDKIGAIGFSHGAAGVLYSAEARFVEQNFGKQIISAGVAYYPYCSSGQLWKRVIPVQIHSGLRDNWTPASFCRDLAKTWQAEYYEYERATHGFDIVGINAQSFPDTYGKRHSLIYDSEHTEQSRQRTKQFLDKYLK
jgi:dienelactone hydrolase